MDPPITSVPLHEFEQAEESGPLVSVEQWVVANQVPGEHGSLPGGFRVSVDAAEPGSGCSKSGRSQCHEPIYTDECLSRDVKDAFRDCEVIGEVEVLDVVRYRASLSRIARFSSMNRSSLF